MIRKKTDSDVEQPTELEKDESTNESETTLTASEQTVVNEVKYSKEQIMKVAAQKFELNRTEAIAAFFDAPAEMSVAEAEEHAKKFKGRKVT